MASLPYGTDTNSQLIADMALSAYKAQVDSHSDMADAFMYGYKAMLPEHRAEMLGAKLMEKLHEQFNTRKPFGDLFNDWPPMTSTVNFKRYKKPIMDRVIDLAVFYTEVTGERPSKLLVGYEEMRQIRYMERDLALTRPIRGMLGMLDGMAVIQEPTKHHLECV